MLYSIHCVSLAFYAVVDWYVSSFVGLHPLIYWLHTNVSFVYPDCCHCWRVVYRTNGALHSFLLVFEWDSSYMICCGMWCVRVQIHLSTKDDCHPSILCLCNDQ